MIFNHEASKHRSIFVAVITTEARLIITKQVFVIWPMFLHNPAPHFIIRYHQTFYKDTVRSFATSMFSKKTVQTIHKSGRKSLSFFCFQSHIPSNKKFTVKINGCGAYIFLDMGLT